MFSLWVVYDKQCNLGTWLRPCKARGKVPCEDSCQGQVKATSIIEDQHSTIMAPEAESAFDASLLMYYIVGHVIVLFTHAEPYYCEMMGNHKSCKTEESCIGQLNILRAPILLLKTTTSSTPWTSRCKDQVCHRWQHPEFGKWWKCISTCGAQNAMDENQNCSWTWHHEWKRDRDSWSFIHSKPSPVPENALRGFLDFLSSICHPTAEGSQHFYAKDLRKSDFQRMHSGNSKYPAVWC